MTRIDWYEEGESTIEVMNNLASYLLKNKMISDHSGVQESSEALCEFQIHVIKKRKK